MDIVKATLNSSGNHFRISVPISKVNAEKRQVSGFATLDNIDQTDDVITAAASQKAFNQFRGNIREQHNPHTAVGKMVDFTSQVYYDPATQKSYNGIYVTAYVSKGAQDTWEKVLDGTLSGFSVGGNINESDVEFDHEMNKSIRMIKDYDLVELSLVDSPCNQFANIFSIEKSNGATLIKGIAAETEISNVLYCDNDQVATVTKNESSACPKCDEQMVNIGWIESASDMDKALAAVVSAHRSLEKAHDVQSDDIEEGGIKMDENSVETEVVEEAAAVEEVEAAVEADAEDAQEVEKAAEVSEVEADEPDFEKMLADLKTYLTETITKSDSESADALRKVQDAVAEIEKTVTEIRDNYETLSKTVADVEGKFDGVEKRLEVLDKAYAVKKSEDLGGSDDSTLTKSKKAESVWDGAFLGSSQL